MQQAVFASRYMATSPLEVVAGDVRAGLAKPDEERSTVRKDWFELTSERAEGGRTALRNLNARMRGLAEAAQAREAAERVAQAEPRADSDAAPVVSRATAPAVSPWGGSADLVVTPVQGRAVPAPSPVEPTEPPPTEPTEPPPTEPPATEPPPTDGGTGGTTTDPTNRGQQKKLLGLI